MFDFLKSKQADVIEHRYLPLQNFQLSTQEFYAAIEAELKRLEVPGLEIKRIDFHEGSLLSAKREYLRLSRERLVFDICAAPFGTSYFFSCRFAELPIAINPMAVMGLLVVLSIIFGVGEHLFGAFLGMLAFGAMLLFGYWFLRNTVSLGFQAWDIQLLKSPLIGGLYERFIRPETYYRVDTRLMYLTTVYGAFDTITEQTTAAKGVKLLKQFRRIPPTGDLYHESIIRPPDHPQIKAEAT